MEHSQIQDAFVRMAETMECPRCGHVGFDLTWKQVEGQVFALSGTVLGGGKIPHIKCRGCGTEVDGNVPR